MDRKELLMDAIRSAIHGMLASTRGAAAFGANVDVGEAVVLDEGRSVAMQIEASDGAEYHILVEELDEEG